LRGGDLRPLLYRLSVPPLRGLGLSPLRGLGLGPGSRCLLAGGTGLGIAGGGLAPEPRKLVLQGADLLLDGLKAGGVLRQRRRRDGEAGEGEEQAGAAGWHAGGSLPDGGREAQQTLPASRAGE
jgi:hypothetical protein